MRKFFYILLAASATILLAGYLIPERKEMPSEMVKAFKVQVRVPATTRKQGKINAADPAAGEWQTVAEVKDNFRRLVKLPIDAVQTDAVRIVVDETWGAEKAHIFAFDVR